MKRKLDAFKEAWVDKLPQVLWAIRTTSRTTTGQTHFFMTYRIESMSPIKVGLPSPDHIRKYKSDFLEEKRDESKTKLAIYQRNMAKYCN